MRTDLLINRIKELVEPGTVIPKPEAKADFKVKGWGRRRGEPALVYFIPNRNGGKPYEKGVTESEFRKAYAQLQQHGTLTRDWFNTNLADCAKEGGCNFTTIGGIFKLLGIAEYADRGIYEDTQGN